MSDDLRTPSSTARVLAHARKALTVPRMLHRAIPRNGIAISLVHLVCGVTGGLSLVFVLTGPAVGFGAVGRLLSQPQVFGGWSLVAYVFCACVIAEIAIWCLGWRSAAHMSARLKQQPGMLGAARVVEINEDFVLAYAAEEGSAGLRERLLELPDAEQSAWERMTHRPTPKRGAGASANSGYDLSAMRKFFRRNLPGARLVAVLPARGRRSLIWPVTDAPEGRILLFLQQGERVRVLYSDFA